jgi:hypothetical protein
VTGATCAGGLVRSEGRAIWWILGGLGPILLVAGLSWFFSNFERRTREIDTGYSAAARRNPFLAAERFLTRLGIPVESRPGHDLLRDLPSSEDALVVNRMGELNAERRQALHRWIERGGRLLIAAVSPGEEAADRSDGRAGGFLDRYGVRLREHEEPEDWSDLDEETAVAVRVNKYPHQLEVGLLAHFYLEETTEEDAGAEARDPVSGAERPRLLQYEIGDGMLTVASDIRFLTNSNIGRHDNALFLALLARSPGSGKVWLLYDSAMPWLGVLLWRHAPLALLSALVLIILFLWSLGGRLGPFLPSPSGSRRDLLVHLEASADFLWRVRQGSRLIESSRARIEHAWLRRHPLLRRLDRGARAAWIAHRAGLSPPDVRRVLDPMEVRDSDLVAHTLLLQRVWASLSSSGRAGSASRRPMHTELEPATPADALPGLPPARR